MVLVLTVVSPFANLGIRLLPVFHNVTVKHTPSSLDHYMHTRHVLNNVTVSVCRV